MGLLNNHNDLIVLRDRLLRNLRAGEGISFAKGPFAQYEQERIDRRLDLQRRLREIEEQLTCARRRSIDHPARRNMKV